MREETEVPEEWGEYLELRKRLTPEQRIRGPIDGWPEWWVEIDKRIGPEERLLWQIFGWPSLEEVRSRPTVEQRRRGGRELSHRLLKEQVEDVLDCLDEK
jgi:hypothetical protein